MRTIVGHGVGTVKVAKPLRRKNASIARVVLVARRQAIPEAVESARTDAMRVARAAGLTLGKPIGIEREVPPYGYGYGYEEGEGVYGPGQWCRTWRRRYRCNIPNRVSVRMTLTIAAS